MMVKICGITRREDAEASVDAGASAIGFIFYPPSPRYVEPVRAKELGAGLDVLKVGVFVNESAADVAAVARAAELDIVQLYGGESPEGLRVWRAFRVNEMEAQWQVVRDADAVLLDGPRNGVSFDWSNLVRATLSKKPPKSAGLIHSEGKVAFVKALDGPELIVAGGLDSSNVANAIRTAQPWGVDASSKLETAPGIKDHNKVRLFVEAAKNAQ